MHADSEHGLRVQLATALKERDEALAQETYWHNRATEARDELAAANAREDAAETNRDHWRGACVKAMVTGEYPVSPHDDDPQIKSLREAAEASFHGQAYAEMAKRARKAEEALAAARRETAEALERAAQIADESREDGRCIAFAIRALASPAAAPEDSK